MSDIMVWNPIERTLWGVALTILFINIAQYFIRGKQTKKHDEKILLYGFSSLILGYMLYFLSYYMLSLLFSGTYINNTLYIELNILPTPQQIIILLFGEICYTLGFGLFLFSFEVIYKRTKYLLVLIQLMLLFLRIILPFLSGLTWYIIFTFSNFSAFIIFYFLTKWSRFEFKAISSLLLFGLVLFGVSMVLFNGDIRTLNIEIILSLSPLFCIIGGLIALSPLIIKSEYFLKAKSYWFVIGMISIILVSSFCVFFVYLLIFIEFSLNYWLLLILSLFFTVALIVLLNKVLSSIKSQPLTEDSLEDKVQKSNLLKIFSKPQKVSEEEVSISKEKGVCLVCKSEIRRLAYICPECKALYCDNCSKALSNLENACWVCTAPFDESKPVKPLEKYETEPNVDIKDKKI